MWGQIRNAYRLTFGAFDARLTQAIRITRVRLNEPADDKHDAELQRLEGGGAAPPYTGFPT